MRIAVAADQNLVAEHFSKCEGFRIYEFEGETIHVHDYVENDGSIGNLGEFFEGMGVSTIVVGGIGQGQLDKMENNGLWVFKGIQGEISEAILKLKQGMLISDESPEESSHQCCGQHDHGSQGCGSHGKSGGCSCL